MAYSIVVLLQLLLGIYGTEGSNVDYKEALNNDPGLAVALGVDPNCIDCDPEALKIRMIELEEALRKDGGITGDNLGGS